MLPHTGCNLSWLRFPKLSEALPSSSASKVFDRPTSCLFKLLWTVPGLNFLCQSLSTSSHHSSPHNCWCCFQCWTAGQLSSLPGQRSLCTLSTEALTQNPNTWKTEAGGWQSYLMRPSLGKRKGTLQSPADENSFHLISPSPSPTSKPHGQPPPTFLQLKS